MSKHVILFLAANPIGTEPLRLGDEERAIRDALDRGAKREHFQLETRSAVRPLDLVTEFRRLQPSIVHFSGHGRDGSLFFEAADGLIHEVSGDALASIISSAGASIRVLVLNACYSEQLARTLTAHIDYVVGMAGQLTDEDARAFTETFYRTVGDGHAIEKAFEDGRAAAGAVNAANLQRAQICVRQPPGQPLVLAGQPAPFDAPRSIRQPARFRGTTLAAGIVELLQRVPGASSFGERSKMIPPVVLADRTPMVFERNRHIPRLDFELILAQLENLGLPLVEEMLHHVAKQAPLVAAQLLASARELRVYIDGSVREAEPAFARPADASELRLRSRTNLRHGDLPLACLFEGNNASPSLEWSGAPANAASFAVVMEDLDREPGGPRYLWVQHSIPGDVRVLPENAGSIGGAMLGVGVLGCADGDPTNLPGYRGPPAPRATHRYSIHLYALSRADLPAELSSGAALLQWIGERACVLADAELVLYAKSPFTHQDFLFQGNPILGRLFGAQPRWVFAALCGLALLLLALPAWLIGIDDLPGKGWTTGDGAYQGVPISDNRGFFHQPNWLPIYCLAVPLFFACSAGFARWVREAVQRIARRPGGVITAPPECPFTAFVQAELARTARRAFRLALIAAVVVGVIDTYPLISAHIDLDFTNIRPYWAIAHLHAKQVDRARVIVFDVIAYLFEAGFVFLFGFITVKFYAFLQILSKTIRGKHTEQGYVFTPFWLDRESRLGLSAVGVPYTGFIALATVVTAFAFLHRVQLLSEVGTGWSGYMDDLRALLGGDWSKLGPLARAESVTTGMLALLLALTIPAAVIAYFPLYQLRRFIQRQITEERDVYRTKMEMAHSDEEREELSRRHKALKEANVWPNGDATAWISMSIWVTLFGSAVYPPFLLAGGSWLLAHSLVLLRRRVFPRAKDGDEPVSASDACSPARS